MKYHFDSSDDEQEQDFIKSNSLTNLESYLNYIVSTLKIDNLDVIEESETLKMMLLAAELRGI